MSVARGGVGSTAAQSKRVGVIGEAGARVFTASGKEAFGCVVTGRRCRECVFSGSMPLFKYKT